jgi:hypothetical protein
MSQIAVGANAPVHSSVRDRRSYDRLDTPRGDDGAIGGIVIYLGVAHLCLHGDLLPAYR